MTLPTHLVLQVPPERVVSVHDVSNIYHVPLLLLEQSKHLLAWFCHFCEVFVPTTVRHFAVRIRFFHTGWPNRRVLVSTRFNVSVCSHVSAGYPYSHYFLLDLPISVYPVLVAFCCIGPSLWNVVIEKVTV